jgi:glucose/arabinose dehydrogenase
MAHDILPDPNVGAVLALLSSLMLGLSLPSHPVLAAERIVDVQVVADLDKPWAMAFLPDGRILVTEKRGQLLLVTRDGASTRVANVPEVAYGGQGGLGDVALHPDFASNGLIYLSYVEEQSGRYGAVVARARLLFENAGAVLHDWDTVWRQDPKTPGRGHYGHRILFGPDGYLWISSGDRQKFDPAQDMSANLGKILRLKDDGSIPVDNPFADQSGVSRQVWSLGHRNPLGLAFDQSGKLWSVEMGPQGGDELNLIQRAANYGYPVVSNGDHYDGREIPDHDTRAEFRAPVLSWTPVISPGDLIVYTGSEFPDWQGSALIAGLSAEGIVRVILDGDRAQEIERIAMGARIRAVTQGPDGAVWILEDGRGESRGRLLRLRQAR